MATETLLKVRLLNASKTHAEWTSADPVLKKGEIAYSSDKKQIRVGDGSSKWSQLSYIDADHIVGFSNSGSTITYTKADGSTGTITLPEYDIATSSTPGLVKSGGNITVASDGTVTVNTATKANQVSGTAGSVNADRHVWFSDSVTETVRNYDDDFKYNPNTNTLKVAKIDGVELTGTPKAPTAASGTNSTQIATTAFVQNAVGNVEIGGRNLVKDSHKAVSNDSYATADYYFGDDPPLDGEEVTIQIKGKLADTKSYWYLYNSGGSINCFAVEKERYDATTGIYTDTGTWRVGTSSNTFMRIYAFTSSQSGTSTIEWVKLERGNKPTDWTPAPEDLVSSISLSGTTLSYKNPVGTQLGSYTLSKANVGLGNVDNTSDANKPISAATQNALDQLSAKVGNAKQFTGTCSSAADATAKVVTCTAFTADDLVKGTRISVYFDNTNTGAVGSLTLNVNSTGAKSIKYIYNGTYESIPGNNYIKAGQIYNFTYDGTYWVVDMMYNTDADWRVRSDYGSYTAGSVALFPYSLILQTSDGRWESIVTSSTASANKAKNSHGFLLGSIFYKDGGASVAAGAVDRTWRFASNTVADGRYHFNIENTAEKQLVVGNNLYLVGTIGSDGLFYLDDTWWSQSLPTTDDGKCYIYLGAVYSWYQYNLDVFHPIFRHDGNSVKQISLDSLTVNGHTIEANVPSNAVFTDTKVTQTLSSTNANYPLILGKNTTSTTTNYTDTVLRNNSIYANLSTGALTAPILQSTSYIKNKRKIYNIAQGVFNTQVSECILYTGFKINSNDMVEIHVTGYLYGSATPIDILVNVYLYSSTTKLYNVGGINVGGIDTDAYLYQYTKNSVNYLALGLHFPSVIYYPILSADIAVNESSNMDISMFQWEYTAKDAESVIPTPDNGVTCIQVPYKTNYNPKPTLTIQGNSTNIGTYNGADAATINITKSSIGLGNVENKSSATIRGELTSSNVTTALGYTPVNKAGDTMTGKLTLLGNQYTDAGAISGASGTYALNLANSNIIGVNSIFTADASENAQEGIHFYRSSTTVDSLHARSGVLYFTPNRTLGQNGTDYTILHSNNYINYTPKINDNNTSYLLNKGAYVGGSGAKKYLRITLPNNQSTIWNMFYMEVSLRMHTPSESGGKILIQAVHNSTSPYTWTGFSASVIGYLPNTLTVYASDGKYFYILNNTSYASASVNRMLVGDTSRNYDISAITVDWVDELPETYETATMYYGLHTGNVTTQLNDIYVKKAGDTMTGGIVINPPSGSYNEGVRINQAPSGWSAIVLGGAADSTSGVTDFMWGMFTYNKNLYISHNGSSNGSPRITGTANGWEVTGALTASVVGHASLDLPLTAGSSAPLSNSLYITKAGECGVEVNNTQATNPNQVGFIVGLSGNGGIFSRKHNKWIVFSSPDGNVVLNGNANTATTAGKLSSTGTIQTDLASTSAVTYTSGGNITPGIKGILPVSHGGTGKDSFINNRVVVGNDDSGITSSSWGAMPKIFFNATSPILEGWERICKITAISNSGYANFILQLTGNWSNAQPSIATFLIHIMHTSASIKQIGGRLGNGGHFSQLRLVNESDGTYWLDLYHPAQDKAPGVECLQFFGNVELSDIDTSRTIFTNTVTPTCTCNIRTMPDVPTFKIASSDGSNESNAVNFDGTNVVLKLPSTIKANLEGNATSATTATTATSATTASTASLAATANEAKALITTGDNRSVATSPNDYNNKIVFVGLKEKATVDNPSSDTYSYVIGLRGWANSSGGKAHEFAFNDSGIYTRMGSTTSWESWRKIMDDKNWRDVITSSSSSTLPLNQGDLSPIQSETYTDVIGTANTWAGGVFFFGSIKPTSWNALWEIKYKIRTYVPNKDQYDMVADVMMSGTQNTIKNWYSNNTVGIYYPAYYHELYRMKQAGFTNGYGHALGVRLQSAYSPTDANYKRTIVVDVIETKNCEFTFFDSCLPYASIPGTGSTNYDNYSEINYVTNGLQEQSDTYEVNYQNREYGVRTTTANLYRYQLCMTKSNGSLVPINTVNNSVATDKVLTTDTFDPFGEIFFWNTTSTANANSTIGASPSLYRQIVADLRYSFNCGGYDTTPTLTARNPLYLVVVPQSNGLATLHSTPLSESLPTSDDGLLYIYLGRVYDDNKPYRVALSINHPIYKFTGDSAREISSNITNNLVDGFATGSLHSINSDESSSYTMGQYAIALGGDVKASGNFSTALNFGTVAAGNSQTVIGKYNTIDTNNASAFIIGNGTADDDRSNALTVDWDGNITTESKIYAGVLQATNGLILGVSGMTGLWQGILSTYYNTTLYPIINNYKNGNITIDSCSGALFLGYANTTQLNFMHDKLYVNSSGDILGSESKTAIRPNVDTWLRINDTGSYTSGTYFGTSLVRTDGYFQVGGTNPFAQYRGGSIEFTGNAAKATAPSATQYKNIVFLDNGGRDSYHRLAFIEHYKTTANENCLQFGVYNHMAGTGSNSWPVGMRFSINSSQAGAVAIWGNTTVSGSLLSSSGRLYSRLASGEAQIQADNNGNNKIYMYANSDGRVGIWHNTADGSKSGAIISRANNAEGVLFGPNYGLAWIYGYNITGVPIISQSDANHRVSHMYCSSTSLLQVCAQPGTREYKTGLRISLSTSDKRMKENIKDTNVNALSVLNQIKMRQFDWNVPQEYQHQNIGMIADEIEQIDPHLASGGGYDKDGNINVKSIDTFYLMGYLVKAVQELSAEVDRLKNKQQTEAT